MGLFDRFSKDIAIDLGTANTLVYLAGKGIMLREPSIIALQRETGEVISIGVDAKRMAGRVPDAIQIVRPLKDGVIANFEVTRKLIEYLINKVGGRKGLRGFIRPRLIIGIPSGITEVEMRAVIEAAIQAGAREARLVQEPMAATIGADLPVGEPTGNMIVDVGGGTCEVAVISLNGIVAKTSIRVAGDEMNEAVLQYLKRQYNLLVGIYTAEEVKIEIGSAFPFDEIRTAEIKGRDLITGLPRTVTMTSEETRIALNDVLISILDAVKATLEVTPPDLAADIIDRGIFLAGGGSLLKGMDKYISEGTGILVNNADNPVLCVALGAGKIAENIEKLWPLLLKVKYY
ncbi:MAG TPA: rod shape-determining protein [Caldisericia bacterium]|nr:rod shape-determining protein [Caldisericia bacterium]